MSQHTTSTLKDDAPASAPSPIHELREAGIFEGYAAIFNTPDIAGDIILPGAFRQSLQNRDATSIRLFFDHDWNRCLGQVLEVAEDDHGLRVRGRLDLNNHGAKIIHRKMLQYRSLGLSVGFKTVRAAQVQGRRLRKLHEIYLFEISLTFFPMHPLARTDQIGAGVAQRN
jgi:uncharacterized protein